MSYLNYNKKVLKEFEKPSNIGSITNPDGHGKVGNPKCGDVMEIFIKVKNNKITDVKARTFGCVAAIATTSVMTKLVKGKTLDQAKKLTKQKIIDYFGEMPPVKVHCSLLGIQALHKAIEDYETK